MLSMMYDEVASILIPARRQGVGAAIVVHQEPSRGRRSDEDVPRPLATAASDLRTVRFVSCSIEYVLVGSICEISALAHVLCLSNE